MTTGGDSPQGGPPPGQWGDGEPADGQPRYGEPAYGRPWYGEAGYGQPAYGPGYQGWGAPPSGGTSALSIVALVCACLLLAPVALVLGIVALVTSLRSVPRRSAGAAVAAVVISSVTLVVGAAVLAVLALAYSGGATSSAESFPSPAASSGQGSGPGSGAGSGSGSAGDYVLGKSSEVPAVKVGDCLMSDPTHVTDCAGPHYGEVYLVNAAAAGGWPGQETVASQADDLCYAAFGEYTGQSYEDSDYDYGYFVPDEAAWAAGDHRIVCVVLPSSGGQLGGPVGGGTAI